MTKKHISLAFVAVAALLTGCTKTPVEESGKSGKQTYLELAHVGANQTKAALDGTTFPQDGHIGLFLFKEETATNLYADGCANVDYSYSSQKGKWTADPSIKVGGETGYLYGYYPYSGTATNIKAIPVSSSLNGDDVMYATKQTVTSQNADQATITMNHALARVSITVKNNGYTGNPKLSSIKFEDAKIAGTGTLDATSGNITATKADNVTLSVPETAQTITKEGTVFECLLVPSGEDESKQTVTLSLMIDGQVKTVTLKDDNGVIIARNTKSNITLTLSNSGLSVSSVSIDDWNVVEVGGYKVTVKRSNEEGIANDVFLDVTSNGSTVTIKSHSALTGRLTSCTFTPAGKASCTPSIDQETGICTFTISDVQEDITAEVGYMKCNATVVYDSDMGAVKLNGSAVASGTPVQILCGEEAEFTAEANTGYVFVKWTDGSDNDLSTDNPYTISSVASDITLKAVFEETVEILAEVKPAGAGTVTGAGVYTKGSNITLTATAGASGVEFIGWAKSESPETIISTDNPYKFTVSQSASYVAVFRLNDALSGVFTVAANGQGNPTKKVLFSKGNLWYGKVGDASEATFNFEANQYDTTPSSNDNRVENHISHFLWCDNATNAVALKYNDGWNGTDKSFFAAKNFTVNGFGGWSVLTGGEGGEWEYLLNKRETAYGEDRRYAAVQVNGMAGLLIFPDDFSWPVDELLKNKEPQTFNANSSNWNGLNYSVTEFTVLQNNGCVFLPAAGYRSGNSGNALVNLVGDNGYYWSASPSGSNDAYDLYFSSGSVNPIRLDARNRAQSVRLVTESK